MEKTEKDLQVDAIISDMLEHIPDDKKGTYELILRRCKFYDSSDPLFPIVLFLLFFQDAISDDQQKVAEHLSQLETTVASAHGAADPKTGNVSLKSNFFISRVFAEILLGGILLILSLVFYVKFQFAERELRSERTDRTEFVSTDSDALSRRLEYNLSKPDVTYQPDLEKSDSNVFVYIFCTAIFLLFSALLVVFYVLVRKLLKTNLFLPDAAETAKESDTAMQLSRFKTLLEKVEHLFKLEEADVEKKTVSDQEKTLKQPETQSEEKNIDSMWILSDVDPEFHVGFENGTELLVSAETKNAEVKEAESEDRTLSQTLKFLGEDTEEKAGSAVEAVEVIQPREKMQS